MTVSIKKTLREALGDKDLTLGDLFVKLHTMKSDISYASLVSYQNGSRVPRVDRLAQIADALGVTTDSLITPAKV